MSKLEDFCVAAFNGMWEEIPEEIQADAIDATARRLGWDQWRKSQDPETPDTPIQRQWFVARQMARAFLAAVESTMAQDAAAETTARVRSAMSKEV